jgi:hypothetical protein
VHVARNGRVPGVDGVSIADVEERRGSTAYTRS